MLFNIRTMSWDDELLELLDIPRSLLPEVRMSSEVYGEAMSSFLGERFHWPELPGISRRRSLGRPVSRAGWQKIPTAPVASCS